MAIGYTKTDWSSKVLPASMATGMDNEEDGIKQACDLLDEETDAGRALTQAATAAAQKTALGLDQVDNTSDANKPVSTAQATAITAAAQSATNEAAAIAAGTATTTPNDTDKIPGAKSDGSLLYYLWSNIKTAIWTAFGGLISGGTTKTTPADADTLPLSDSESSNATKKLSIANWASNLWTRLGALIASGTNKATIVDADKTSLSDSASSNATKYATAANWFTYISGKFYAWIVGLTAKTTPIDADSFHLADSAGAASKKLTWANLKATLWAAWGALVNSGTSKTTPVDADAITLMDSAASNATKKLTWANLVATIKTALGITYTSGTLTVNGSASTANIPTAAPTATPTASRVPIADANAELNTWINSASLLTKLKSAPNHISRYAECASLTPDKFMVFKVAAGRFNFSWNYATGRRWFFPPGTVVYGTSTSIRTSTDAQPDVTIPTGGGYVVLVSGAWGGNYTLIKGNTTTSFIGSLSDFPALTYYLYIYNCSLITGALSDLPALTYLLDIGNCYLITGALSDLPALTYYLGLINCSLITGALPVPTASTFKAYKIDLSGCTGIEVANSIVNMASYWNGKTASSGAYLNMGTLHAEYDVTTEVSQLVAAGFTVTYTPY